MSLLGTPARGTPIRRTPEGGASRVIGDARGSQAVARALVTLVERLEAGGKTATAADAGLRDALRQLASRSRDGVLLCRVSGGELVLEGVPQDQRRSHEEPVVEALLARLKAVGASSLTIREGASPGELLTLAMTLASGDRSAIATTPSQTPTTVHVFGDGVARELLRTWSVLLMPVPAADPVPATTSPIGQTLSRLASARHDEAVSSAVAMLVELLEDAQRRGDATVVEHIARGTMAQLQTVGAGGGRLAIEMLIRLLLHPPTLRLLASKLPHTSDRGPLLQLMSRAGDLAVETLTQLLLQAEDPLARRAYFDGIVAMDVGSLLLFELLRDARWYVVRNAAALLGEMRVDHSDEALIPLLTHKDERIRIAVARALSRVRTPQALAALHSAINDLHPEVRRISASAFGLASGASGGLRPTASRLALALERETNEDVALEMLAALGRLGSADAVQRLLRIVLDAPVDAVSGERSGEFRDAWQRIAALEALIRARGGAMASVIDGLLNDADREVAAAARRLQSVVSTSLSDR